MSEFSSSLGFKTCSRCRCCRPGLSALYRIFGIFARDPKCQEQGLCRDKMSRSNGRWWYVCLRSFCCPHHRDVWSSSHQTDIPCGFWKSWLAAETRSRRQIEMIQISWARITLSRWMVRGAGVMNCGRQGAGAVWSLDQSEASSGRCWPIRGLA